MTKPRIAILVLVLLAVLFAVALAAGLFQDDERPAPTPAGARAYEPPRWASGFNALLEPLSPRLRLQPSRIAIGPAGVRITVPRADDAFRKATFRRSGSVKVRILYEAAGDAPADLRRQEWPQEGGDQDRGTLIILKGGGRLTFACVGLSPCAVVLE